MAKIKLFGFKIGKDEENSVLPSFAAPVLDDGAVTVTGAGHYGLSIDLDNSSKNENELITRYRELAMQPEVEQAIDDIINEAVIYDNDVPQPVSLNLEYVNISPKVKKAIDEEFNNVLILLNFKSLGSEIFRRFYVDGRLNYNILLDPEAPGKGIQELRYIDPRKLTKIRELKKSKGDSGVEIIEGIEEYFVYTDQISQKTNTGTTGIKIAPDSIIYVTSGLMDAKRSIVLSYLHKCIKPMNQLRMIEDASIIYKISRAPERRIFYVDVGNLPKMKAEQYMKDLMSKYKNKVVFDSATGQVRDDRRYLSMQEDFWMPRRDGKSTEITTLPSSAAFDDMSMVQYFERKVYQALNVPYSRHSDPDSGFDIGRSDSISRDEVKFSKFVSRLRNKFSDLFDQALRVQCVAKGICTREEFEQFKQNFIYDWKQDNNYAELKLSELISNRVNLLSQVDPYVGKYFSQSWIQHKVLNMTDDEIEEVNGEIQEEINDGLYPDPKAMFSGMEDQQSVPTDQPQEDQSQKDQSQEQNIQQNSSKQNPYYK